MVGNQLQQMGGVNALFDLLPVTQGGGHCRTPSYQAKCRVRTDFQVFDPRPKRTEIWELESMSGQKDRTKTVITGGGQVQVQTYTVLYHLRNVLPCIWTTGYWQIMEIWR